MIDLKRNLFKIDIRAQKDEEKVFMRTAWVICLYHYEFVCGKMSVGHLC